MGIGIGIVYILLSFTPQKQQSQSSSMVCQSTYFIVTALRLGAWGTAIENRFTDFTGPSNVGFQTTVCVSHTAKAGLKRLQKDPETWERERGDSCGLWETILINMWLVKHTVWCGCSIITCVKGSHLPSSSKAWKGHRVSVNCSGIKSALACTHGLKT